MPPKTKITKDEIIETALELVRKHGESSINARAIASFLNCSTQPIFSNFSNMDELRKAVITRAYNIYLNFIKSESENQKYPQYKAFGMAYVRFANEEKALFKLLFMRDRTTEDLSPSSDFEKSVEIIMKNNNVTREKAMLIHLEVWSCVHGIGVMLATSFLPLEYEFVSDILTDVYQGIRARHLLEEK